jgi:hypothetical protein
MNSLTNMPGQFRTVACSMFSAVQFTLQKRRKKFRTLKNSIGGTGRIESEQAQGNRVNYYKLCDRLRK